jgi:acetyl-CoA synthetase
VVESYDRAVARFRWRDVVGELGWAGRDTVNLAETIVDRQATGPNADRTALLWLGRDGAEQRVSYGKLAADSARFANLLNRLGVRKGDRVAALMPRLPETLVAMLGAFKAGAVHVPIFTGFGPDAVRYRLTDSRASVLCTHHEFRAQVPEDVPVTTICVTEPGGRPIGGDIDFAVALGAESDQFDPIPCRRDDPATIIYTSGSTGQPKGGVIAVNLLAAIWPYMRYGVGLDARADLFWPTGDPGWGYGLCCYLTALAMGATVLSCQANTGAEGVLQVLERHHVTNMATTPTLLRGLMALGEAAVRAPHLRIRSISSCGEPLNGEVVEFFRRVWGVTPMDHYGATECGLPLGNFNGAGMAVKAGSMGLPAPGYRMAIVDEAGSELATGEVGLIGLRPGPDSLYWLGYWEAPAASDALRRNGWICPGDLGRRDGDGYFWFEGRADDIIKSAGYRIGPFEVESAILKHGKVAEAAVVGVPDTIRGQNVKAFVVLRSGEAGSPALASEITDLVRNTLGRHQYPREVEFVDNLPKTETGKIQRYRLRDKR